MDPLTVLQFGAALLGMGSMGLCLVQFSNRRLRGIGWLSAAFAAGFLSATVRALTFARTANFALLTDLLSLLALALLHVAVMEMLTRRHLVSKLSATLLASVLVVDLLGAHGILPPALRLALVTTAVVIQCFATASLLVRTARASERMPAVFCGSALSTFALYNVFRIALLLAGQMHRGNWDLWLFTYSYAMYIAMALGLAFGFFWISTSQLSVQLEHMAGIDPLTRLYNRRTFLNAAQKELSLARSRNRSFSILMVDLDHFKQINDRWGHPVGDAALVAAVEAMQNAIRGSDVLARWGGEEFAALLPNADNLAAHIVAERIRLNVERAELPVEVTRDERKVREIIRMTVSVGLATFSAADDIESLMHRADQHLYLAKDSGRNRVLSEQPVPAYIIANA